MNRWAYRLLAILMVLVFLMLLANLQKQLVRLQQERQGATTTAPATST